MVLMQLRRDCCRETRVAHHALSLSQLLLLLLLERQGEERLMLLHGRVGRQGQQPWGVGVATRVAGQHGAARVGAICCECSGHERRWRERRCALMARSMRMRMRMMEAVVVVASERW
jgi:hypothetical protein